MAAAACVRLAAQHIHQLYLAEAANAKRLAEAVVGKEELRRLVDILHLCVVDLEHPDAWSNGYVDVGIVCSLSLAKVQSCVHLSTSSGQHLPAGHLPTASSR